jgi:hypothetical protein
MHSLLRSFRIMVGAAVFSLTMAATLATAETYIYNFDVLVTGNEPAEFDIATLTIEDVGTDSVMITLDHNDTSETGVFISRFWFNLNPFVDLDQTDVTPFALFNGELTTAGNALNVAGYHFDFLQRFNTNNVGSGENRLEAGESVSFVLSGEGLSAADFNVPAEGNIDPMLLALIQLQGPGMSGARLGVSIVPEPATLAALAIGVAALARRRAKKV